MRIALLTFALLLALAGARASAGSHGNCAWGAVSSQAGCLVDGHSCSPAHASAYRRDGFACRGGFLRFDWTVLRRRPIVTPQLAADGSCPVSSRTGTLGRLGLGVFPAWGAGPAWPAFDPPQQTISEPFEFGPGLEYAEWGEKKVMWAIDPRYVGPTLVRGHQVGGPNELRFENGSPGFTAEQRLHPASELRFVGGYVRPAVTRVRELGCYAYQIDGIGFSRRIVFEAVAAP